MNRLGSPGPIIPSLFPGWLAWRALTPRKSTMSNQGSKSNTPTLAECARQLAERIGDLAEDVNASFQFKEADQRVHHLQYIGSQILYGMLPVMNWIERTKSAVIAELVKRRLHDVLYEAVECTRYEIPEFRRGAKSRVRKHPSEGALRTATMGVTAKAFADSVRGWADEIETGLVTPKQKTPRLMVDLDRQTITLDKVAHDINSVLALRWVKVLADHRGQWISSSELQTHDLELDGARPDRLKKFLPVEILSLISTDRRKGARLCLAQ
jgi:hypothetical protein